MKAKSFMNRVEKIDCLIKNKLIEREQWKDIAMGITARLDGEKVKSSGSNDKIGDAIARFVDLEAEINHEIDRMIDAKREILEIIEQLPPEQYDILHARYIQKKSFKEIAVDKKISYSMVTTLHGNALKSVQILLDERMN